MFAYNIYLIGFMGTGKSTVASRFGEKYGMEIVEMDETISYRERRSVSEIFAVDGEEHFRDLETNFLRELRSQTNIIVSCGGGVILRRENIALMRANGKVVLLTASPEEILKRVKEDNGRPILEGKKNVVAISELMQQRQGKYEEAADITVCTDKKTVEEICEELMRELERMKER